MSALFSWNNIVSSLGEKATNIHFTQSIDYYSNLYSGDIEPEKPRFTEENALRILKEITKDAEYTIRLVEQEKRMEELKKDWPNVDKYIESLCNRGSCLGITEYNGSKG